MKTNKELPQWLSFLIGLIAIVIIQSVFKYLHPPKDKWKSFEAVTNKAAANLLSDTIERKKWCKCVIETFKKNNPDGLEGVSQESLNTQMSTVSYDCIHAIRSKN